MLRLTRSLYRRSPPLFQKSTSESRRMLPLKKLSTARAIHDHPSDPALSAKFKCHPTIPYDIPVFREDLNALWFHIPSEVLPENWTCDWLDFQRLCWFLPSKLRQYPETYSMSPLDMVLNTVYGVSYPIKGLMYCLVQWRDPDPILSYKTRRPQLHERIVLQGALGDYYYHYEFCQGGDEFVGKFRVPPGTDAEDFVRNYFRGAIKGVDMDQVLPEYGSKYDSLKEEQRELAKLQAEAHDQSRCACNNVGRVAKVDPRYKIYLDGDRWITPYRISKFDECPPSDLQNPHHQIHHKGLQNQLFPDESTRKLVWTTGQLVTRGNA